MVTGDTKTVQTVESKSQHADAVSEKQLTDGRTEGRTAVP